MDLLIQHNLKFKPNWKLKLEAEPEQSKKIWKRKFKIDFRFQLKEEKWKKKAIERKKVIKDQKNRWFNQYLIGVISWCVIYRANTLDGN